MGARTPTRMRAEGDMCSVVFPKRIAVEVMVVKPVLCISMAQCMKDKDRKIY